MKRWYVASLADIDTHFAKPTPQAHLVAAHCDGREFRPLVQNVTGQCGEGAR